MNIKLYFCGKFTISLGVSAYPFRANMIRASN